MNGIGILQNEPRHKQDLLLRIVDEQNIERALELVRDIGQYTNAVYHLAFRTDTTSDMPFIRATYPAQWIGHYVMNQYQDIDPVLLQAFDRTEPFFWSELIVKDPRVEKFFDDAEALGAGRNGYSIPLTDNANRKAIFSVTSNLSDPDLRLKIKLEGRLLGQIGDVLHRKAITELYGTDEGPSLSPREIECLYWTAHGKDIASVAHILSISIHTARDYLKSARLKLGCRTVPQAIHLATKRRLISF